MAGEHPCRLNHRDAELKGTLVLDAGCATDVPGDLSARGCSSRRRTHEMSSINLDFIAPTRAHLAESELRVLELNRVLDISEADRNAGRVCHRVRADADRIGGEDAGGGA